MYLFHFVGRNSEEIERKSKDRGTQISGSPQDLTNPSTVDIDMGTALTKKMISMKTHKIHDSFSHDLFHPAFVK